MSLLQRWRRWSRTCLACGMTPDEMDTFGCNCPQPAMRRYHATGEFRVGERHWWTR